VLEGERERFFGGVVTPRYIEWREAMDLSPAVYSRDLKIATMRALDARSRRMAVTVDWP
jgi:hypothetical protein